MGFPQYLNSYRQSVEYAILTDSKTGKNRLVRANIERFPNGKVKSAYVMLYINKVILLPGIEHPGPMGTRFLLGALSGNTMEYDYWVPYRNAPSLLDLLRKGAAK